METVIKYKNELRENEFGRMSWVKVPYEKFVFTEEEKMRIVSEYIQSREPAQDVVNRYKLSNKQILFNWMDKYLHEESLSLSENQIEDSMANKNPEDRIKELEAENKQLMNALKLEKLRSKAYDTMITLAETTFNIPIRKKSGTKQ